MVSGDVPRIATSISRSVASVMLHDARAATRVPLLIGTITGKHRFGDSKIEIAFEMSATSTVSLAAAPVPMSIFQFAAATTVLLLWPTNTHR